MTSKLHRVALGILGGLFASLGGPALADGIPDEPLARFEAAVCPGVIGLELESAEQVVGRIRSNVEELGLRLANPETCEPNIIVVFLADGQDYLQRLADERPHLFSELTQPEKRELLSDAGPARAWLSTVVRTRDGQIVGRRENLTDLPQADMWSAHSRIYRPVRRDIDSAMVLINRDAIDGLSVGQLADYATMRSLARTYPEGAESRNDSILALFEEGANLPAGLSEFDQTFLANLYNSIPNLPASARFGGLPGETDRVEE